VLFAGVQHAGARDQSCRAGCAAGSTLKLSPEFVVGANDWYLARVDGATVVLKVREGIVQEIPASRRLVLALPLVATHRSPGLGRDACSDAVDEG
jgi:hypothetical protein